MTTNYDLPSFIRKKNFDKFVISKIDNPDDKNLLQSIYRDEDTHFILMEDLNKSIQDKATEIFKSIYFTIIPDNEHLFRYIHPEALPVDQKEIPPAIFMDGELSCDWLKFCSNPEDSLHINEGKTVIIRICICDDIRNPKIGNEIKKDRRQDIFHNPVINVPTLVDNFAHSLIAGRKRNPVAENIARSSSIYKDLSK